MTADELLALPDDGKQYELARGELREMVPANPWHSSLALRIGSDLERYVRERRLGMVTGADGGYILCRNPDTVRAPDVGFVEKVPPVDHRGLYDGAPDMAIEVLSPNDLYSEIEEKIVDYLVAGTRVIIVVDPKKQAAWIQTPKARRQLTINDSLEAPDLLPGWSLPLRELFA
jgi:Uma2 family endonuclease